MNRLVLPVLLVGAALTLPGCLDKPKLEDRWTRLDVLSSNLRPYQIVPAGSQQTITVRTQVTFRSILTGFAVAELRASSVSPAAVGLDPQAPRLRMAEDIDLILANSVSLGRATRAVTGWDHLMQTIDFTFSGTIPATMDSTSAGVFLLCYLGSGDEVEQANGTDSLVVTPFVSTQYEILPTGLELNVGAGSP